MELKGNSNFLHAALLLFCSDQTKIEQKFENVKLYLFIGTIKWYNQIHKRTNVLIFNRH